MTDDRAAGIEIPTSIDGDIDDVLRLHKLECAMQKAPSSVNRSTCRHTCSGVATGKTWKMQHRCHKVPTEKSLTPFSLELGASIECLTAYSNMDYA